MNTPVLPESFRLRNVVDFRYNGKLVLLINLGMIGITVLLVWAMAQIHPFTLFLPLDADYTTFQRFMVPVSVLIFLFLYGHVRELLHLFAFVLVSRRKPVYHMRVFSASAGQSHFYFSKAWYLFITLFPFVSIAVILGALLLFLPDPWFWVVFIIEAFHISSGVKDVYICSTIHDAPKDSLIWDDSSKIKIYAPEDSFPEV